MRARRSRWWWVAAGLLGVVLAGVTSADEADGAASRAIGAASRADVAGADNSPAIDCRAVLQQSFRNLRDAPTTLLTAVAIPAAGDLPSYCRVQGIIAPQVQFELRLPAAQWNGRLLVQGCGGMCGAVGMESCEDALVRGYAVINTDMGHAGNAGTATWALNDFDRKIDFGYRATHVVTIAAKALVKAYYGKAQHHAYFRGCSTGGRQALVEAQRFPDDFDGIVAGAPPLDESGDAVLHLVWSARASLDAQGHSLFDPDKIPLLHGAALAACGGAQGGFIAEPRNCRFDPAVLQCRAQAQPQCLTAAEVQVARRIYQGAWDAQGHRLFPGGMAPGSELEWVPLFIGRPHTPIPGMTAENPTEVRRAISMRRDNDERPVWAGERAADVIGSVMMAEHPGPGFDLATTDFDTLRASIRLVEPIYSARNPDLRAFEARGGRMILHHGWLDAEIPPGLSIDYYESVVRAMGGLEATQKFFRLFMLPGVAHCRRGPGGDAVDFLSAIEAWVERGEAPQFVTAVRLVRDQNYMGLPAIRFPVAAAEQRWAQRVYAYPLQSVPAPNSDARLPGNWRPAAWPLNQRAAPIWGMP